MTRPQDPEYHRTDNKYSPDWREPVIRAIVKNIDKGECISLIGVGTVGKTHFINFFRQPRQINHHLRRIQSRDNLTADDVLFVPIDPNGLLYPGDDDIVAVTRRWTGFELIAASIYDRLNQEDLRPSLQDRPNGLDKPLEEAVEEIYRDGIFQPDPAYQAMAFRFLEDLMRLLFQFTHFKRIVLIFDEFEALFTSMPAQFFTNLRALRDRYRYRLIYMTTSRIELHRIPFGDNATLNDGAKDRLNALESFLEIFKVPVYLGPAHGRDFEQLATVLNNRLRTNPLQQGMYPILQQITAGHAGLLRTVLRRLDDFYQSVPGNVTRNMLQDYLTNDPDIRQECNILLKSCSLSEQEVIRQIVEAGSYLRLDGASRHANYSDTLRLSYKGLLEPVNNDWQIVPPLLRHYVQSEPVTDVQPGDGNQKSANPPDNPPPPPPDLPQ
jgi:hypothetical protein